MSRLVLITGATGFAGSHILDACLAAGHRVRVPVRPTSNLRWVPRERVELVSAEMREPASLRRLTAGVSWVFHFAGLTRTPRRAEFFEVNTHGTCELYRAAREASGALECFLFCSSLAASGPAPAGDRPRRESDPPAPITTYGESKLAAERWLGENHTPGCRLVIVRPAAIYGPRDDAILSFFRWVSRGLLPLPPGRESRVSLIHARDLANACLHLAETERGNAAAGGSAGLFHVSDGGAHRWEEVGAIAGDALGRRPRAVRLPRAGVRLAGWISEELGRLRGRMPVVNREKARDLVQPFWICDISKLQATGFTPQITIDAGIRETVAWYRQEGWL